MIYVKNSASTDKLTQNTIIRYHKVGITTDIFMNTMNMEEEPIYTFYLHDIIASNSTITHIPFDVKTYNFRYIWIDGSNTYVSNRTNCYTIPYDNRNRSYICIRLSKDPNNQEVVLEHSNDWGEYELWITLRCTQ